MLIAALALLWPGWLRAEEPVDFNRDIRPLLSSRCLVCHGPDERERAADLRLDTEDGSRADLGGYAAIVPGDPGQSELIARLTTGDDDLRMPPPDKGPPLSDSEIDLFSRWIDEGAGYARHWAYENPTRPPVPEIRGTDHDDWPRNPIDHFILARLLGEGLGPSPAADRATLARRAAIDLTGLPPTWQEAREFIDDPRQNAYEVYVDRLLAAPSFGERWARVWLDLARYADSAGYADDPPRTIWAFRDYVIRSLNENKPFDQFTIEQIAGDLLQDPTEQQLVATAFHRNTLTNNEGGTNDEEFRNVAVVDRVNTTMAVWMGTTMACAQCHTHKYDPITQEEYFRFFDFFNQTEDTDKKDERPLLELWSDAQRDQRRRLTDRIASLQQTLRQSTPVLEAAQQNWLAALRREPEWIPLVPQAAEGKSRPLRYDAAGWVTADGDKPDHDQYELRYRLNRAVVADPGDELTGLKIEIPADQQDNFVLSKVTASWTYRAGGSMELAFAAALADHEQTGFPAAAVLAAKVQPDRGWAVAPRQGKPHQLTLILERPLPIDDGTLLVRLHQQSKHKQHVLNRFRLAITTDGGAAEWARMPPAIRKIVRSPSESRDGARSEQLAAYYRSITPLLDDARADLARAQKELSSMKPYTTVPVMRDLADDQRRTTHVQIRGNYQSIGDRVGAATPAAFHPLPDDGPRDRLALARWLVDEQNPLTPRVIANRHWEELFGVGIVSTSEEFGSQGQPPSHPLLLDWLAVELRESGWDLKHLLKLLVTSATYRQSSSRLEGSPQIDPQNRWYAYGPRFRISAEMVRDQVLFVSGLLSDKLYGNPVNPPQPSLGLKAAFGSATDWKTSPGEDRYRRGIYTSWRRSSPYPSMAQFDAPNREVCTVRRIRTNTPLQALVTMNDPVYVEAAQALARRMVAAGDTAQARIEYAFRHCLIREPTEGEVARLSRLAAEVAEQYRHQPQQARRMASDPIGDLPDGADVVEMAAWTVVGNVILNLDEMFMKR